MLRSFHLLRLPASLVLVLLALPLFLAAPAATQPAPLVIESYDAGRTDSDWGFTEPFLAETRAYVQDPASFGPSGVVPRTFTIAPGVAVASAATLASADVFFTGWVETASYTATEKTALRDFALGGGTLIATTDDTAHTMVDTFGLTQGDGSGFPTLNTITNTAHPVAGGPFGAVTTFNQYFNTGHYPSLGPDAVEVGRNAQGTSLAVIDPGVLGPGSGAVILVADVDVFSNGNAAPNGGAVVNERLIKNIFAFAAAAAGPDEDDDDDDEDDDDDDEDGDDEDDEDEDEDDEDDD
jgi:hypothetical protein